MPTLDDIEAKKKVFLDQDLSKYEMAANTAGTLGNPTGVNPLTEISGAGPTAIPAPSLATASLAEKLSPQIVSQGQAGFYQSSNNFGPALEANKRLITFLEEAANWRKANPNSFDSPYTVATGQLLAQAAGQAVDIGKGMSGEEIGRVNATTSLEDVRNKGVNTNLDILRTEGTLAAQAGNLEHQRGTLDVARQEIGLKGKQLGLAEAEGKRKEQHDKDTVARYDKANLLNEANLYAKEIESLRDSYGKALPKEQASILSEIRAREAWYKKWRKSKGLGVE